MLNALVTVPFLLALAVAAFALCQTLQESARKVLAALSGHSLLAEGPLATRPVHVRYTLRELSGRVTVRTSARWRAAA